MQQIRILTSSKMVGNFVGKSQCAYMSTTSPASAFNKPISGIDLTRSGGIATMFRLPYQNTSEGLDACFVGIPFDIGVSNRSGTRMGPRHVRVESVLIREYSSIGAAPFESLQVADIGDLYFTTFNMKKACEDIRNGIRGILKNNCTPISVGGDHTVSYPILQAIKEKYGAVGLVHVDAHSDVVEEMQGEKIGHGTPFKRAFDEGLIIPEKTIQIGLRGSGYTPHQGGHQWQKDNGFRVVQAEDCWHKSMSPLMKEVKGMMGDIPVYISFDIDALDPAYAPGTGTPEIGGLTSIQAMEIIRGCRGLNVVGADLVEVSPPYDVNGTTSLLGANLLFEMLCILPGVKYYQ